MDEWTYQKSKEWMLEAACDVCQRIPKMLQLTGMWLLLPEASSLGTGGRDWQRRRKAKGVSSSGAGAAGLCAPTRPSRAKENEISRGG